MDQDKAAKIRDGQGFIAALDQSGGSTPKALRLYGVSEDAYSSEEEMFDLIHEMRARIVRAPSFTGDKVIGAILFEQTMDRDFEGVPAAQYLWEKKGVVPFLKIDKGLADETDGVQLMKPIAGLDATLERAREKGVFGTKERSVINAANAAGIESAVKQQFEVGAQVLSHDMVPILEPEVTISISDKAEAEEMLRRAILDALDRMPGGSEVMLKLTLPEEDDFYRPLAEHPRVMRVVALSGGYSQDEATERLARNGSMIASFSRALTEGLSADQDDAEFEAKLADTIESIRAASVAG
ncbi:Fructose-bisphosphate aldolase class 1 [Jannaschia seosinensis]|uniref:fructose-bisphosphate aldolase n=1 Tax=Jannaschia seosinensis TaxID=313367 RepID=A0A0M7BFI1_9RHOB|nr:fructose bisphosphate aldolase [Jannaschia seosinensis]CUH40939.1 Fructose-bisphosphate aldolase class 1 [Jannaschia seosinensis]